MKDLAFCKKFVEYHASCLSTPGLQMLESYIFQFLNLEVPIKPMPLSLVKALTCHNFSIKDLDYWTCVIKVMGEYIGIEIKAMLRACLAKHYFDPLVDVFLWLIDELTSAATELCKIEESRDPPPKIFIPIPKIESNGCARSDSLICSLIF